MYAESLMPVERVKATLLAVKNGSLSADSYQFQQVIDSIDILILAKEKDG